MLAKTANTQILKMSHTYCIFLLKEGRKNDYIIKGKLNKNRKYEGKKG